LIISRGITSQLQVLDVLVNRPFKDWNISGMANGSYLETVR
jgi:hypothetical protein